MALDSTNFFILLNTDVLFYEILQMEKITKTIEIFILNLEDVDRVSSYATL